MSGIEDIEVVAWQFEQDGWNIGSELHNHKQNTVEAGFPVRDLMSVAQCKRLLAAKDAELEQCKRDAEPMQPLAIATDGVLRFKQNKIIRDLLDFATTLGFGLNEIAREEYSAEDRMQLAQLIGYSLSGYGELSYVTDESYDRAERAALNQQQAMSEQVKLLRTYNQWRRGEIEGSMDDLGLHPADIGKAIDAVLDDYATLQAGCERLRGQVAALQSDANSYQSGFDAGRKSEHAHAQSWRKACEQAKADLVAIKAQDPVAFRYKPRDGGMWSYVDWREPDDFEQAQCVIEYLSTLPTTNQQLTVK